MLTVSSRPATPKNMFLAAFYWSEAVGKIFFIKVLVFGQDDSETRLVNWSETKGKYCAVC